MNFYGVKSLSLALTIASSILWLIVHSIELEPFIKYGTTGGGFFTLSTLFLLVYFLYYLVFWLIIVRNGEKIKIVLGNILGAVSCSGVVSFSLYYALASQGDVRDRSEAYAVIMLPSMLMAVLFVSSVVYFIKKRRSINIDIVQILKKQGVFTVLVSLLIFVVAVTSSPIVEALVAMGVTMGIVFMALSPGTLIWYSFIKSTLRTA